VTALEAYRLDHERLPFDVLPMSAAEVLQPELIGTYLRVFPKRDGWGNALQVWISAGRFGIVSFGSDGLPDVEYSGQPNLNDAVPKGSFQDSKRDIIFFGEYFFAWPEGISHE
jgi:hypothetical protein